MDASLTCPRCRTPLQEVQMAHGIFWGCNNCGGRAITVELLRRTFSSESINSLWLHAISGEGKGGLPCPSCQKPMIDVALSENASVDVDVCAHCHFVWFDRGKIETLTPIPVKPAPAELPQEARELLAMEKVKDLAEQARGSDFDSAPPDDWWKWIAGFLGVPVEFDAPEETHRPWATWILSFAIVLSSVLAFSNLGPIVDRFGLIPAQATRLGGLTFVTAFFLHAGIIHLVGNMYFLVVFGDNVEDFLGPARYLMLIALAAFVGDLLHIASNPHSQIPSIGASGGIAGVIVFYALKFPHVRLGFLFRWFFYFRWIRMPAWFVLILWGLFQLIGAYEQKIGVSSVSSFAHLGGTAVGVVAWWMWRDTTPEAPNPNTQTPGKL